MHERRLVRSILLILLVGLAFPASARLDSVDLQDDGSIPAIEVFQGTDSQARLRDRPSTIEAILGRECQ